MSEKDLVYTDETKNFEPSANSNGSLEIADLCKILMPLFHEGQCVSGEMVEAELARQQLKVNDFGFDAWKDLWDYACDFKKYFDIIADEQGGYSLSQKFQNHPDGNGGNTPPPPEEQDPLHDKIIELIADLRYKEKTSPPGFVSVQGLHEALIGEGQGLSERLSLKKLEEFLQSHSKFYDVQDCTGTWKCAGQMIVKLKIKVPPPQEKEKNVKEEEKKIGGEKKTKKVAPNSYNQTKVTKCSPFKLHDLVLFDNYDVSLQQLAAMTPQTKGQNWHAIDNRDEDHPLYYLGLLFELNFGNVAISSDIGTLTDPSNFYLSLSRLVFFSGFYTDAGRPIFAVCEHLADTYHSQQYRFVKFEVR